MVKSQVLRWIRRCIRTFIKVQCSPPMPPQPAFILVANHFSVFDPIILYGAFDFHVVFLSDVNLRKIPVIGRILCWFDTIPVHKGFMDKQALLDARQQLQEGRTVGIFPSGGISPDQKVERFKTGASWLSYHTQCHILPIFLDTSSLSIWFMVKCWLKLTRPSVAVVVGDWVPPPDRLSHHDLEAHRLLLEQQINMLMLEEKPSNAAQENPGGK